MTTLKNNRSSAKRDDYESLMKGPGAEMVGGVLLINHKEAGRMKGGVFYVTHPENMPDATEEDIANAASPDHKGTQFMTNSVNLSKEIPEGAAPEPNPVRAEGTDPLVTPYLNPTVDLPADLGQGSNPNSIKGKHADPDPHPDPHAHPPEDPSDHSGRRSKSTL